MRPRSSLKLMLTSTLPLALGACHQADTPEPAAATPSVNLLVKSTFSSLRECAESPIPMEVCSLANTHALSEHRQNTFPPSHQTASNPHTRQGDCLDPEQQNLNAQMKGFELTLSGSLSRTEWNKIHQPLIGINAVRTLEAFNKQTELVLASLLAGGQSTKFFSRPVYEACNNRLTSSRPTLLRNFTNGSLINHSSASHNHSSASHAISRGGFGNQAKARSGWSSSSSSRFSFGG